jgi:hypothetical protein
VCLGTGVVDAADGPTPCRRCYGSGRCSLCQEIALVEIEEPPLFRLWPPAIGRRRTRTQPPAH